MKLYYTRRRQTKYRLFASIQCATGLMIESAVKTAYLEMTTEGILTVLPGYAWDGPSGPAYDTDTFMRASLVHDALYQLIRTGVLTQAQRKPADELMRKLCIADGMSRFRAGYSYWAVRLGGKSATQPEVIGLMYRYNQYDY